jgi:DNA-binding transcriptional LysR family regulator
MEFHQLRYFVAAAEELSISKAAERVHVSQPALSRQIKLLEDEIGVKFFDRIKQRIHLTEAGKFFLINARQLLCDSESAIQRTQENFGGVRRTLRLGFLSPFLDDLLAPVIREFQQRHVRSKVSLFDLSPRAQLDRLRLRELDIGILANIDDEDKKLLDVHTLSRNHFIAVIPEDQYKPSRHLIESCIFPFTHRSPMPILNCFWIRCGFFMQQLIRKLWSKPQPSTNSAPLMRRQNSFFVTS